jgi:hypothetical protein
MADIIDELKSYNSQYSYAQVYVLCDRAAGEIEKLRGQIAELKARGKEPRN